MWDLANVKIYLAAGATDMRKSILGLSYIVEQVYEQDPSDRNLYLFCNGDRTRLKILQYDVNGYCLYYKRLDTGRFAWPRHEQDETIELSEQELMWLLHGVHLVGIQEGKTQALKSAY